MFFFRNISQIRVGGQYSYTLCEILVAIVFGHEIHIFIPNCTEGGGVVRRLRKYSYNFFTASLIDK